MSKTLTKQYYDGTLPSAFYYFHNGKGPYIVEHHQTTPPTICAKGITVLCKVPNYTNFSELGKKVELLQKQLKEANHILKDVFISDAYYKSKQVQYLKKWGVK